LRNREDLRIASAQKIKPQIFEDKFFVTTQLGQYLKGSFY